MRGRKDKRPQIDYRTAYRILINNGYHYEKQKGSHHHFVKNGNRIVININLNQMVWQRLVKENELILD